MKPTHIVSVLLLMAAAAVVWRQDHAAAAASDAIAGLRSRVYEVSRETARLQAVLEEQRDEAAGRGQPRPQHPPAGTAGAGPPGTVWAGGGRAPGSAAPPLDYWWSDEADSAWVPKDCLAQIGVRVFASGTNNEWRVSEHAAAALVLGEAERTALNQALAETRWRYEEITRAHFSQVWWPTAEQETNGIWRAKYAVSSFREEAAGIRQQFADAVRETLQGEKAEAFLKFMGDRTETPFGPFGDKERTILLDCTRGSDGRWTLEITETGVNTSRPVRCGPTTNRYFGAAALPPHWRALIQ